MARLKKLVVALSLVGLSAIGLSACGAGGAIADAKASCLLVDRAIALQKQSHAKGLSAQQVSTLQTEALTELLKATPKAAEATSADGSWNPLMTTINEAERVPFDNLTASLAQMCQVANSQNPYLGQ